MMSFRSETDLKAQIQDLQLTLSQLRSQENVLNKKLLVSEKALDERRRASLVPGDSEVRCKT